jgi:Transposase DDE domain
VDADLDTLATALYAEIDDLLKSEPYRAPWRPGTGIAAEITDAELLTLAVMQALLGHDDEARWARYAGKNLRYLFPYIPGQSGYCKRLKKLAGTMRWLIRVLGTQTSMWSDDVWVVDSTPVECGRSRETARRSDLAGWAEYGYCASHSRYFWGLRLHLLCTLHGLPVGFALTGAKADERLALLDILADEHLTAGRDRQIIIGDKNYYGKDFEATLADGRVCLLRKARKGEPERPGGQFFKPLRQIIESVNATFKGQLGLERHGGRTPAGVIARVLQRILALTAAIWHNDRLSRQIKRSLIAYDH